MSLIEAPVSKALEGDDRRGKNKINNPENGAIK